MTVADTPAALHPHAPSRARYEPIGPIGRGGMAEVLLAIMHAGGGARRLAVLKRIWPELATDPDFLAMFLDEARLSLRMSHANVVQTYEVLVDDGRLAMAMEYLDGQPLTRVLTRLRGPGELSLPLRLRIASNVLAGLDYAHELCDIDGAPLGVVHRDVSPQNVFVTYDGQVKLVDFGVAKTLSASHQTRPGAIKGKLAYMAPEQLQRATVDRRADLFAVGVMLWEMLAGRRLWHGMTELDIVGHLAAGRPLPPLPFEATLPPALDAICARALAVDPEQRYQTAAAFEMDIAGVLVGAADSHARNLGSVVSLAFSAERAERQAMVDQHLRGSGRATVRATPPTLTIVSGGGSSASGATVVTGYHRAASHTAVDVTLSGLEARREMTRRLWIRRGAVVATMAALVMAVLVWRGSHDFGAVAAAAPAGPQAAPRPPRVQRAAVVTAGPQLAPEEPPSTTESAPELPPPPAAEPRRTRRSRSARTSGAETLDPFDPELASVRPRAPRRTIDAADPFAP
jgi:serine/threonine-protein kinase